MFEPFPPCSLCAGPGLDRDDVCPGVLFVPDVVVYFVVDVAYCSETGLVC